MSGATLSVRPLRYSLLLVAFLLGSLLTLPATSSAQPSYSLPQATSIGTINGCVGAGVVSSTLSLGGRKMPANTILRVIPNNQSCATNETALSWNVQGPAGASLNPLQIATLHWYDANLTSLTYPVGANPQGVAFDGANIWVANYNSNNVTKLKASDGSFVGAYPVGSYPYGVAFDGANIWVAQGITNVTKLKASDGSLVGTYQVGTYPQGVAFDGANIWVTNALSNNVTKLKASDGSLVGTYPVGSYPYGVAFDGANIWVTNFGSNNVSKL